MESKKKKYTIKIRHPRPVGSGDTSSITTRPITSTLPSASTDTAPLTRAPTPQSSTTPSSSSTSSTATTTATKLQIGCPGTGTFSGTSDLQSSEQQVHPPLSNSIDISANTNIQASSTSTQEQRVMPSVRSKCSMADLLEMYHRQPNEASSKDSTPKRRNTTSNPHNSNNNNTAAADPRKNANFQKFLKAKIDYSKTSHQAEDQTVQGTSPIKPSPPKKFKSATASSTSVRKSARKTSKASKEKEQDLDGANVSFVPSYVDSINQDIAKLSVSQNVSLASSSKKTLLSGRKSLSAFKQSKAPKASNYKPIKLEEVLANSESISSKEKSESSSTKTPLRQPSPKQSPPRSSSPELLPPAMKEDRVPPSFVDSIKKPQQATPRRSPRTTKEPLKETQPTANSTTQPAPPAAPVSAPVADPSKPGAYVMVNKTSYQLISKIGYGGSCTVFNIIDKNSKKQYALKVVNLIHNVPAVIKGFKEEIRTLQSLKGCRRVVQLIDYEFRRNKLYIVMEKGDISFDTQITEFFRESDDKYLHVLDIRFFLKEMLECVNSIHLRDIVHSDLKPANFILVRGRLKLIDFGISKMIEDDNTSVFNETIIGSLDFMAPETLVKKDYSGKRCVKYNTKSDVWSLGIILYYLLYSRTPFEGYSQIIKSHSIIEGRINYPDHPYTDLIDLLKLCLQKDPLTRPSIDDLLKHPILSS